MGEDEYIYLMFIWVGENDHVPIVSHLHFIHLSKMGLTQNVKGFLWLTLKISYNVGLSLRVSIIAK